MTAVALPRPAPLVLADEQGVSRTASALVANRRHAGRDLRPLRLDREGVVAGRLGDLLSARELLVLATGAEVAAAVCAVLLEPPTLDMPPRGSAGMHLSPDGDLRPCRCGRAPPHGASDHVCVVLGHREPEHQRRAPHLARVARPAAPRRVGRASASRRWRPSSPATRRPAASRRPSRCGRRGASPTCRRCSRSPAVTRRRTPRARCRSCWRSATCAGSRSSPPPGTCAPRTTSSPGVSRPRVGFAFDRRGDWPRMVAHELRAMRTVRTDRSRAQARAR